MDTNLIQNEDQEFQDALDSIPEEVRDYMWSPAFDYAIDVAEKVIGLTPEEKEYVRDVAYDLLMRLIDLETAATKLLEQKIIPEKVSKIVYYLDQEILESARNLVNYYGDVNKIAQENSSFEQPITNTPNNVLAKLDQSFTAPTTIIPKKTVYTDLSVTTPETKPAPEQVSSTAAPKQSIDPYRENPLDK